MDVERTAEPIRDAWPSRRPSNNANAPQRVSKADDQETWIARVHAENGQQDTCRLCKTSRSTRFPFLRMRGDRHGILSFPLRLLF